MIFIVHVCMNFAPVFVDHNICTAPVMLMFHVIVDMFNMFGVFHEIILDRSQVYPLFVENA